MEQQQKTVAELRDTIATDLNRIGYKTSSISSFKSCVNRYRKYLCEKGAPDYYDEHLATEYLESKYNYPACLIKGEITEWTRTNALSVNRLAEYGLYGAVKVGDRKKKRSIHSWAGEDEQWVIKFLALDRKTGNSKNTTAVRCSALQHFYEYLTFRSVNGVTAVTAEILSGYATSREGNAVNYVHTLLTGLRTYLRYLFTEGYISSDISQSVPQVRSRRNLYMPALWSKEELETLLTSIDRGNACGKRDYAILSLLIQYGIRASDVAGLRLEHINWQHRTIEFAQHKTGRSVSYPILDSVGWALIEYIRDGRPKIENPYVFLTHFGVPREFACGGSLCGVLARRMKMSGIRKEAARISVGPHSLRHAVARRLVSENIDLATAADILGDTTLKAASIYLRSDMDGLRECALSLVEVGI